MTREERHIAVLNRMLENMDVYDSIQPTTERKKAIEAAIKALSQEPCESINKTYEFGKNKGVAVYWNKQTDTVELPEAVFRYILSLVPTVNPQPSEHFIDGVHAMGYREGYKDAQKQKSGKWVDYSDEGYVECPFCGHATNCEDDIDELHYCFYCGAKMESEDKE